MRKTVLSILAASLIVGSTVQIASAAERHTHKSDRASASQQFRDANDFLPSPSVGQRDWSTYSEGYMASGPVGR